MPKTKALHIFSPCSSVSTLKIQGQVRMEEFVLPAGSAKGRVLRAKVSGAGGIDATVDYVNHVLTVAQAPSEWVIRISDGINMEAMSSGLKLTVLKPLNIIPVADPATKTIGYFVADQPPQEDVSGLQIKPLANRRKKATRVKGLA